MSNNDNKNRNNLEKNNDSDKVSPLDHDSYGIEERTLDSNDVYDDAEIASTLEINFIAQALKVHKTKMAAETHPDFDGVHCVDCDDEIPEGRLALNKVRCVHCQEFLDDKNKMYNK